MSPSVDPESVKNVFLSAMYFATSSESCPPFHGNLKLPAQEQVDYMIVEDADAPLFLSDDRVKFEVGSCLLKVFSIFEVQVNSLSSDSSDSLEVTENTLLKSLLDLEWICNVLAKMDMLKDFIISWLRISNTVLAVLQKENHGSCFWVLKGKILEIVGKVLEAIGYGNVVIPAPSRVQMLKIWLPYIRKCKLLVDLQDRNDQLLFLKIDSDLCDNIEAAIVSLVSALPSNDQADIFSDWLSSEKVNYPNLSDAFELWCYRSKAANRRCVLTLSGSLDTAT